MASNEPRMIRVAYTLAIKSTLEGEIEVPETATDTEILEAAKKDVDESPMAVYGTAVALGITDTEWTFTKEK